MVRSAARVTLAMALCAGVLAIGSAPAGAQTPVQVVCESAVYHPGTQTVYFTIVFDSAPDFTTTDAAGRIADQFQYYLPSDQSAETIIRAHEVPADPTLLRIRAAEGTDPDPASGGWGPVLGVTHFELDGSVLTFAAPLGLVAPGSRGRFSYDLETFHFGSLDQIVRGESIIGSPRSAKRRGGCGR